MKKSCIDIKLVFLVLLAFVSGVLGGIISTKYIVKPYNVEQSAITDATTKVSPAVVSILSHPPSGLAVKAGSGFIVSSDGLIVTSRHLVEETNISYTVTLPIGHSYRVSHIQLHPSADLALLQIVDTSGQPPENLPVATLGDSDTLQLGQQIISMSSTPIDHRVGVSFGVVSGLGRSLEFGAVQLPIPLKDLIETDASIHLGASGGPLVNLMGQVIGVNTALESTAGTISYGTPLNEINSLLELKER